MLRRRYWHTPGLDILTAGSAAQPTPIIDPAAIAQLLGQIGLVCHVTGYTSGAHIATYHLNLTDLRHHNKIARAVKALSMALCAPCTLAPSDRAHFAVQVPKDKRDLVTLRQVINTREFGVDRTPTTAALGLDDAGRPVVIDVSRMPHILIGGATGTGKSVALNTILCSMLYCATPTMTQFVMIDPKQVEMTAYTGLPHLARPIVTDPKQAAGTLGQLCGIMDQRYKQMSRKRAKSIDQIGQPRIIVVIDEFADLMMVSAKTVEADVIRIAQLGRAAGIHLILATQKPLVSVVTGLIQGNIPAKLALQTASTSDSVRILGHKGAEQLLGRGDALLKLPDRVQEIRLQCAYTSDNDIAAIVNYWRHDAKRRG